MVKCDWFAVERTVGIGLVSDPEGSYGILVPPAWDDSQIEIFFNRVSGCAEKNSLQGAGIVVGKEDKVGLDCDGVAKLLASRLIHDDVEAAARFVGSVRGAELRRHVQDEAAGIRSVFVKL